MTIARLQIAPERDGWLLLVRLDDDQPALPALLWWARFMPIPAVLALAVCGRRPEG
jgi:hypothetical protein